MGERNRDPKMKFILLLFSLYLKPMESDCFKRDEYLLCPRMCQLYLKSICVNAVVPHIYSLQVRIILILQVQRLRLAEVKYPAPSHAGRASTCR